MYVCMVWYGMVRYGTVWYGMVWYGMYVCIYTYIHIYMFFNCYIWLVEGNGGKIVPVSWPKVRPCSVWYRRQWGGWSWVRSIFQQRAQIIRLKRWALRGNDGNWQNMMNTSKDAPENNAEIWRNSSFLERHSSFTHGSWVKVHNPGILVVSGRFLFSSKNKIETGAATGMTR